jgi:DNA polymerase-1
MNRRKLYIIDGHALIYRAYYAFIARPLTNAKGENTSAVFGFTRMLLRLLKVFSPEHILVTFDSREKTERKKLYDQYKANRKKMPDDLIPQIPIIKEVVKGLGLRQMELPGHEADDIIGTIATAASAADAEVYIISRDKDLSQLIDRNVRMLMPNIGGFQKGGEEFTVVDLSSAEEKFIVPPGKVVDLLALMGDASDNIPGVQGIGPKTAENLLREFRDLDDIYRHIGKVKPDGVREKLVRDKDAAYLSRRLATIKRDLELDWTWDEFAPGIMDKEALAEIFERCNIRALSKEMGIAGGASTAAKTGTAAVPADAQAPVRLPEAPGREPEYHVLRTLDEFEKFLGLLARQDLVAVDSETTSTDFLTGSILGLSFSFREAEGWYVAFGSDNIFSQSGIDRDEGLKRLKPLLEDPAIRKIGQNIKFDYLFLQSAGVELGGIVFDTMLASFLVDPETPHNLDDLSKIYLGVDKRIRYEDLVKEGRKTIPLEQVPLEKLGKYSAEDADLTWRLHGVLSKKLEETGLVGLFDGIDMPLMSVLAGMERAGVKVDRKYLNALSAEFEKDLGSIEKKVWKEAGVQFNLASTKQLQEVLFGRMKIPPVRKTKTGSSTDVSVLEELAPGFPVARMLLEYRTLSKLKNTYTDRLPELVNPATGRIHTSFNQAIVATGRLSSTEPNLQNIPVKEEVGRRIRNAFVAEKGWGIISSDYSQIELRILAHISEDPALMDAFIRGEDVHSRTARELFGIPADAGVPPEQRRAAKVINFGVVYGMGPYNMSRQLDIPAGLAKEYIDRYFERYVRIKVYYDTIRKDLQEKGYVANLFGRRRYFAKYAAMNRRDQESVFRMGINTPIQGTAADLIKVAMINIGRELKKRGMRSKMVIQVHDELVFEVPDGEKDAMLELVRDRMENARAFKVPIVADIKWGRNWAEAH